MSCEVVSGNSKAANTRAIQDGKAAPTDLEWGGTVFTVEPGSEAKIAIEYDGSRNVSGILFYFDSATYEDSDKHTGSVTVSGMVFTDNGAAPAEVPEINEGESGEEGGEDAPETKTGVLVSGELVSFTASGYAVEYGEGNASMTVSYENLAGGHYESAYGTVASIPEGHEAFTAKIANNGAAAVRIRLDMSCEEKKNNNTAANIRAEQDGKAAETDLDWGGSVFTIEPGKTSEIYVEFDPARTVKGLLFYFDSATYEDTGVYTGNVTLSGMEFCEKRENTEEGPETDPEPAKPVIYIIPQPSYVVINDYIVRFTPWGSPTYNISYPGGTLTASYSKIMGSTYVGFNGDVRSIKVKNNGFNTFTFTVRNDGKNTAVIGAEVRTENEKVAEAEGQDVHSAIVAAKLLSGEIDGVLTVDPDWHNLSFRLPSGATATVSVEFDPSFDIDRLSFSADSGWEETPTAHSGRIVLSDMAFTKTSPIPAVENVAVSYNPATKKTAAVFSEAATLVAPVEEAPASDTNQFSVYLENPGDETINVLVTVNSEAGAPQLMWIDPAASPCNVTLNPHSAGTATINFVNAGVVTGVSFESDGPGTLIIGEMSFTKKAEAITYTYITVGEAQMTFANDPYTVTYGENDTMTIAYTEVAGNTYANVYGWYGSFAGSDTLTLKVANNGENAAKVFAQVSVSGESVGQTEVKEIAAGGTETLTASFDTEGEGGILLFVDSCWNDDTARSGSVTVSEMAISKAGSDDDTVTVAFGTDSAVYTVNNGDKSTTISYDNADTTSYPNVSADIAEAAAGMDTVSFKLSGPEGHKFRVDIMTADWQTKLNTAMTYGGAAVDDSSNIWYTSSDEKTVTVSFSGDAGILMFFIDAGESTVTASFTVSDFTFTSAE